MLTFRWNLLPLIMAVTVLLYWAKRNHNESQRLKSFELSLNGFNGSSKMSYHPVHQACFPGTSHEDDNGSFLDAMGCFPWHSYKYAVDAKISPSEIQRYSTGLLLKLLPFITRAPPISINETCHAPLLKPSSDCSPISQPPRKVGIVLQFDFDVDALEIHLNELDNLVDKFFITESVETQNTLIQRQPLLWNMLKVDQRFAKFSDKIVHFIVDDSYHLKSSNKGERSRERVLETQGWIKLLEWNYATRYFNDDDLLGFGDVDRVPSRENVFYLKHCQLPSEPIYIGIYSRPYTLGDPTFWTLGSAKKHGSLTGTPSSRMRKESSTRLLGGMSLSRYAYPPFRMAKYLTARDAAEDGENIHTVIQAGMLYAQNKSAEAETTLSVEFRGGDWAEADAIGKVPWFLQCNRERYPGFDRKPDFRLMPEW